MWRTEISGSRNMKGKQARTCAGKSGARLLGGARTLRGWKTFLARLWRKKKTTRKTARVMRPTRSAEMNVEVLFVCSLVSLFVADILDAGGGRGCCMRR